MIGSCSVASGRTEPAVSQNAASIVAALVELEEAFRVSATPGLKFFERTLKGRAETHFRLGLLDEAAADFTRVVELSLESGSTEAGIGLTGLGDVHRERGNLVLARIAYEDALARIEQDLNPDMVAPALCGLARVLVDDEPSRAKDPRGARASSQLGLPGGGAEHSWLACTRRRRARGGRRVGRGCGRPGSRAARSLQPRGGTRARGIRRRRAGDAEGAARGGAFDLARDREPGAHRRVRARPGEPLLGRRGSRSRGSRRAEVACARRPGQRDGPGRSAAHDCHTHTDRPLRSRCSAASRFFETAYPCRCRRGRRRSRASC